MLLKIIKKSIKKVLSILGFEICKINKKDTSIKYQTPVIINPIHHNSKDRINENWGNKEHTNFYFDQKRYDFYASVKNTLIKNKISLTNITIADVGCGTGELLNEIRTVSPDSILTGYEYSEVAINIAKEKHPSIGFKYLDLNIGTVNQHDLVICTEVLEHLVDPEIAISNIVKMIKNFGYALITVPNGRVDTFEGHINFWSPESWERFIKKNCSEFELEFGILFETKNYAIIKRKN